MKIIELTLTKKQVKELEAARKDLAEFALLGQPIISTASMKVAVLTIKEFGKMEKPMKKFMASLKRGVGERE